MGQISLNRAANPGPKMSFRLIESLPSIQITSTSQLDERKLDPLYACHRFNCGIKGYLIRIVD
jgi:hypothetical protein